MAKKKVDTEKEFDENEKLEKDDQENQQELSEDQKKIAELEEELKNKQDAFVRTLAEYDNYRKRSTKEKESIYNDAKSDCMIKLIPVIDNFERASAASDLDFESYKKGIDMIYTNFIDMISSLGIESFGEVGEEFDPNFHNGVMHIDSEDFGESVISAVFSKGYKLGDKVLREAMVQVAN